MKKILALVLVLVQLAALAAAATFTSTRTVIVFRTPSPTPTRTRTPTPTDTTTSTATKTVSPSVTPTGGISGVPYDVSHPGQVQIFFTGININPGPLDKNTVKYGPTSSYIYTNGAQRTLTPGTGYSSYIPQPGPFYFSPRIETSRGIFYGGNWMVPVPYTATDTPTCTITKTRTPTHTPTSTPTATPTAMNSRTPTLLPTAFVVSNTPTTTPTSTRTSTQTPTRTSTRTSTATATRTNTPSPTFTRTSTPTPTAAATVIADWRFENNLNDSGPAAVTLSAIASLSYDTGAPACSGTYAVNTTLGWAAGDAGVLAQLDGYTNFTFTIFLYTSDVTTLQYPFLIRSDGNWGAHIADGDLVIEGDGGNISVPISTNTCLQVVLVIVPGTASVTVNGGAPSVFSSTYSNVNITNIGIGGSALVPGNSFQGDIGEAKFTTP